MKQNSPKAWLLAARPKTLTGAAVPVMIGVAMAYIDAQEFGTFSPTAALLCLLFAFIMQIDANFVNDFFDYARGNDDPATRLGPLRACTQGWVSIDAMKRAIALTTCLACFVGLPLIFYGGLEMILIGMLCVVFCFLYTTHLSYVGMGDVLVLVFFGIVPVCCTYYVHRRDGKQTLVVKIGATASEWLYLAIGIIAVLAGLLFWVEGHVLAFVLPFLYLTLHVFTWLKLRRIHEGRQLNECLGETARNIFVYGLCVAIGLLLT